MRTGVRSNNMSNLKIAESDKAEEISPYRTFSRDEWKSLRENTPLTLTEAEVQQLRSLNDAMSLDEVVDIYLPLSRLLHLYIDATQKLFDATSNFLLTEGNKKVPYIIGISGSVAAGKSTTARILQALLSRWPNTPKVALVTTDGFLFPNAYLQQNNLMERKGFPESYDTRRLLKFLHDIKAGQPSVEAPVYSHLVYDIVPGEKIVVDQPDILILEGLNVLQVGDGQLRSSDLPFVSDFFDFSIYLDADEGDLKNWYIERFLMLRNTAFQDPKSYFRKYAEIDEAQSVGIAEGLWNRINLKNLHENILPTKSRAALILRKGGEHKIEQVALRKL